MTDQSADPNQPARSGSIDEVPVQIVFELGRMETPLAELETLQAGYVFELGKPLGQSVDILANGKRVGTGELVRVGEAIGVRVSKLARWTNLAIPTYFSLIVLSAIIAVIPFLVVAATSFAKISIVLFLVRNALGIQQTPPGVLINTVAIVLTLFIHGAGPARNVRDHHRPIPRVTRRSGISEAIYAEAIIPLKNFLQVHSRPEATDFFIETTALLWGQYEVEVTATADDIVGAPARPS